MNIENLRKNKCPKCNDDLFWDKYEELLKCSCGVYLNENQFKDYMDDILAGDYHIPDYDDNLRGLNNL